MGIGTGLAAVFAAGLRRVAVRRVAVRRVAMAGHSSATGGLIAHCSRARRYIEEPKEVPNTYVSNRRTPMPMQEHPGPT